MQGRKLPFHLRFPDASFCIINATVINKSIKKNNLEFRKGLKIGILSISPSGNYSDISKCLAQKCYMDQRDMSMASSIIQRAIEVELSSS